MNSTFQIKLEQGKMTNAEFLEEVRAIRGLYEEGYVPQACYCPESVHACSNCNGRGYIWVKSGNDRMRTLKK